MKKLNVFGKILCVSAVLSVAGVIVYLVNTSTGYMAGRSKVDALAVLLPLLCVAAAAFLLFVNKAELGVVTGVATFALSVILAWATVIFLTQRVDVIGDMLNPVNHPASQVTAVTWSIVGLGLYFLAFLTAAVATLGSRLKKTA